MSAREKPASAALACSTGAVRLFEEACEDALGAGYSLLLEVVRDLASDLALELRVLAGTSPLSQEILAEASACCADLATLAACTLPHLPDGAAPRAAAAIHLAAGASRALRALAESGGKASGYALRDLRGAVWRADLATRQANEVLQGEGQG